MSNIINEGLCKQLVAEYFRKTRAGLAPASVVMRELIQITYAQGYQAALRAPVERQAPECQDLALRIAVTAIYFDDSSDYKAALFAIVKQLDKEIAAELLENPKTAYDKACGMIDAAPSAPNQEESCK